ncbi:oxidoreductase [Nesterenkonia sp. MY13]|uniref:Oxidoreductase n=1 Tax=Nesterenkonia sedimenti TaxID=1463632 RepID=A0A7X8TL60_9MICC|nr:proton-conducting transporter membrane subunit [Nesterenkonia sedimenti]NLS10820.1 oxidoreductase [Nesterenkonia sedimenti]
MTELVEFSLGALVLLPLLAAAVVMLIGHTARRVLGVVTAVVTAGFTVPVVATVADGDAPELVLGGFTAPLGITLRGDGLAAVFLAGTALIAVVLTVFAALVPAATGEHLTPSGWRPGHPGFWPLWLGCWAGLNGVYVSGDLFNLYVGLELVGLTAVALVALGGRKSWDPALRYLFIAVLGSLLFLTGVGLLAAVTGTLDIAQARAVLEEVEDPTAGLLALSLMTVGLGMKIALVPMHRWLVPAHSAAPAVVSPILSGLVIKAGLVILLRVWLWAVPLVAEAIWLAWLLGALGAIAVLVGSVLALRQDRLKPLVAYSTIAQIGYWFLAFPLLVTEHDDAGAAPGAYSAIVALAVGHMVAKGGLFAAAGYLKLRFGTDEIARLRGAGAQYPALILAMGACAVGLIGLPVSLGFAGKWQLATAAVGAQQWWVVVVIAAGTLLAAGYLLRGIAPLLLQAPQESDHQLPDTGDETAPAAAGSKTRAEGAGELLILLLGVATIGTGFLGSWIYDLLGVGLW